MLVYSCPTFSRYESKPRSSRPPAAGGGLDQITEGDEEEEEEDEEDDDPEVRAVGGETQRCEPHPKRPEDPSPFDFIRFLIDLPLNFSVHLLSFGSL